MERIECILCDGLKTMERKNLIHHMAEHHRVQGDVNFVLAGCLMKRKEREDIGEIFQELIENIVASEVDEVPLPGGGFEKEKMNEDMPMQELSLPEQTKVIESNKSSVSKKEVVTCKICNIKCPSKRARMKHTQVYHNSNKTRLKESQSIVTTRPFETELDDKPSEHEIFNCGVCNSSFANNKGLRIHKKTNCSIQFDMKESSLKKRLHVDSKKGGSKKRQMASIEKSEDFQCINCKIMFSSYNRGLWDHKRVCNGELIDIFKTSEYFMNHPKSILFWDGADEESLESDPSLPTDWKVKIVKGKVPKTGKARCYKEYYKPGLGFFFRSRIAVMEYIKYLEIREEKQKAARKEEKSKVSKRRNICNISLDPDLPGYFKEHPSVITKWNGVESSLLEDPRLTGGWKIKLARRTGQKHDRQFVTPDRKYVIRTIGGVLEYLQHNNVKDDNIDTLLETLLDMKKNNGHKVQVPHVIEGGLLKNVDIKNIAEKRFKTDEYSDECLETERKRRKAELEEKLKVLSMRKNMCKASLDPDLPEYFKEHPSLITRWYGVESSLLEDPKLTGGWKIKLVRQKTGKLGRQFVTPDRKYVIRSINGVLEYLQHNDVLDENIETLLETVLQMKNNRNTVQVPLVIEASSSKNVDEKNEAEKRPKTDENVDKALENRDRKTLKKSKSDQKESSGEGGPNLSLNKEQNQDLSNSKFRLEDWGSDCKDKIRRLGKYIGDLEVDPKLPSGWKVRLYGKNSKSSSKDYVTPDGKYYVRSHKAVVKYMKLSGNYSDFLIKNTADILGVDMLDIDIEEKKQPDLENKDSIEEMITAMDDEKLLKEVDDEMTSSDHGCDKCDEYRTRDLMELVLHKRLFHGLS